MSKKNKESPRVRKDGAKVTNHKYKIATQKDLCGEETVFQTTVSITIRKDGACAMCFDDEFGCALDDIELITGKPFDMCDIPHCGETVIPVNEKEASKIKSALMERNKRI